MTAAREMINELDRLDAEERAQLASAVQDLATDNPRTELAVTRFKKFALKAGEAVGGSLYKVAADIASEAAKKAILGP